MENTSKMIIAISIGPIIETLFSSRFIKPRLLLVFSTSGLVLEFPIFYIQRIIPSLKIKTQKRLILLYLSENVSAPTGPGPHGARWGESSWEQLVS